MKSQLLKIDACILTVTVLWRSGIIFFASSQFAIFISICTTDAWRLVFLNSIFKRCGMIPQSIEPSILIAIQRPNHLAEQHLLRELKEFGYWQLES